MNRKSLIALVVAGLMMAFAIGTLFARPALARPTFQTGGSGYFPPLSELWYYQVDPSDYVTFRAFGSTTDKYGYKFPITSNMGRYAILTQWISQDTSLQLWKKGGDGTYRKVLLANSSTFTPGVVLVPGTYVAELGFNGADFDASRCIGLIGYWAATGP